MAYISFMLLILASGFFTDSAILYNIYFDNLSFPVKKWQK